jgi:hypothetical protein
MFADITKFVCSNVQLVHNLKTTVKSSTTGVCISYGPFLQHVAHSKYTSFFLFHSRTGLLDINKAFYSPTDVQVRCLNLLAPELFFLILAHSVYKM